MFNDSSLETPYRYACFPFKLQLASRKKEERKDVIPPRFAAVFPALR